MCVCVCVCVCVCAGFLKTGTDVKRSVELLSTSMARFPASLPVQPRDECASGEDEENCPYSHCGPGRLSAGTVCPLIMCPSVCLSVQPLWPWASFCWYSLSLDYVSVCLSVRTATVALGVFLLVQSVP